MDNVESLIKVARELKKNERVGTVGTAATKGIKIGGGLGALGGAVIGSQTFGPRGALGGAIAGTIAGGAYGGAVGANAGLVRALYRSARGHKSVHPNDLKD